MIRMGLKPNTSNDIIAPEVAEIISSEHGVRINRVASPEDFDVKRRLL